MCAPPSGQTGPLTPPSAACWMNVELRHQMIIIFFFYDAVSNFCLIILLPLTPTLDFYLPLFMTSPPW